MHTHILQEYQLKPRDGNGTSKLNIGVFVACLETEKQTKEEKEKVQSVVCIFNWFTLLVSCDQPH